MLTNLPQSQSQKQKLQLQNDFPPLTYGIWIEDRGWLADRNGRQFADPRIEYARAALKMWKIGSHGVAARIELIDESMIGLQSVFLEQERAAKAYKMFIRSLPFRQKLRRWIDGILGHSNTI